MASKIYPYTQYPRYVNSEISSFSRDVPSDENTIEKSDDTVIPSSSRKFMTPLWPALLWINSGVFIFICLVLVVVIPIVVLVDKVQLPVQCSAYMEIADDDTRSPDYTGTAPCDNTIFSSTPVWVRFTGTGGTLLVNYPVDPNLNLCGADAPGWYSGVYPSLAGNVTSGDVCYSLGSDYCFLQNSISVTNCNGFYVFYLQEPPSCILRYCTV